MHLLEVDGYLFSNNGGFPVASANIHWIHDSLPHKCSLNSRAFVAYAEFR